MLPGEPLRRAIEPALMNGVNSAHSRLQSLQVVQDLDAGGEKICGFFFSSFSRVLRGVEAASSGNLALEMCCLKF
jgi:hypothetical protein